MRISDWSSDVCSSDLCGPASPPAAWKRRSAPPPSAAGRERCRECYWGGIPQNFRRSRRPAAETPFRPPPAQAGSSVRAPRPQRPTAESPEVPTQLAPKLRRQHIADVAEIGKASEREKEGQNVKTPVWTR